MSFDCNGVRKERSGWRDLELSLRHRQWGFNCPAVDLDFLMVEYNLGKPVGLVDYKVYVVPTPNLQHPTYRALTELADIAGLPFLLAFYWPEIWAFRIVPVNAVAREAFVESEMLTERQFVSRLYRLRRLCLAKHLESNLLDILPDATNAWLYEV